MNIRHKHQSMFLLLKIIVFWLQFGNIYSGKIKMVDQPFSFNNPAFGVAARQNTQREPVLLSRFKSEMPSGPNYLIENLGGKCFSSIYKNYRYELCPFANVTQKEETYRWNSFHGILGVWKEWSIENNTFVFMQMLHGDVCSGQLDREVKVYLKCGEVNKITSVSEPSMCQYKMEFQTPFACPSDVFYVYPVLSQDGRSRWQQIEQARINGEITRKGYSKRRRRLLEDEGLAVKERPKANEQLTSTKAPLVRYMGENQSSHQFSSLSQCTESYNRLSLAVRELRERIANLTLRVDSTSSTRHLSALVNATSSERHSIARVNLSSITDSAELLDIHSKASAGKENEVENNAASESQKREKRKGDDGILEDFDVKRNTYSDKMRGSLVLLARKRGLRKDVGDLGTIAD